MKLTLRTLRAIDACEPALDWFRHHYPRGLDLTQVTEAEMVEAIWDGLRPEWTKWLGNRLPETADLLRALMQADAVRPAAIPKRGGCWYAIHVDRCARDDTRAAAILEGNGYLYAQYVDCAPRDDTRAAAIREGCGYWYAVSVDRCPRDDTRAAAIREGFAYRYARNVDKAPRDDTRAAAIAEGYGDDYARDVELKRRESVGF